MRYLAVSKDVRRHRLISIDYITTLPVTAEVASSSLVVPAIHKKSCTNFLQTIEGRDSPPALEEKTSDITAACAACFAEVTACVYTSNVDRKVECLNSSCMTLNSVPTLLKSVEYVCRKVCHPNGFSIPTLSATGRISFRKIAWPQIGLRPR
jgi:hypothetical protein